MSRAQFAASWLAVLIMAGAMTVALVAPLPVLVAASAFGLLVMPRRRAFLSLAVTTLALNVAVLALVDPATGWQRGLTGGMRLVAAIAINLAILMRLGAEVLLDGLRLPPRVTAVLAAIILAAHELAREFARLRDARRLEGAWPAGRFARARAAARLAPLLLVAAHRRAEARREALHIAGHTMPAWFVPLVAVAALSAAGRLALLAIPNVALTFIVAFLGGLLYGGRVGAAGAALGMFLTDLLLTGLYVPGLVNAPAMALLGLAGGAFRRIEIDPALAATIGILSTLVFSVAADSLTWSLLYRDTPAAWVPLVLAGVAFNVIPALVNGVLFAAAVRPARAAFRAWQQADQQEAATAEAVSPDAAPSA